MAVAMAGEPLDEVEVSSRAELREWLAAHHGQMESVWLITWKKSDPARHLSWGEMVDELLCFGWIDSLPRKLDDNRTKHLISPRKPKSNWSKVNRDKVEKLIASGLMQAPGLAVVNAGKASGAWDALIQTDVLNVPDDLATAFAAVPGAEANFGKFPKSVRRGILEWILNAKQPATRANRIEETARLAGQNIRANQWRPS